MNIGDYVLATQHSEGDSRDEWCVGFYAGITSPQRVPSYYPTRYNVVDEMGKSFRDIGFKYIKPITSERGEWLLKHKESIKLIPISLWFLSTCEMDDSIFN